VLAALVMAGWIVGELAILTNDGDVVSATEVLHRAVVWRWSVWGLR
jgi:hypothetical protein